MKVVSNEKFLLWMPLDSQCICELVNEESHWAVELHLMFNFSNPKSVILVLNSFHFIFLYDSNDKLLFGRDNADSCMYKVSAVWIFFWTPFISSGVVIV